MKKLKIAIDGPCASGKSTIARMLAARLGYTYINTGAMYRAVGLFIIRKDIDPFDENSVKSQLAGIEIDLIGPASNQRVVLNGEDITSEIAKPNVASAASSASTLLSVRKDLVARQQRMAREGGVVLEGRDIGTVVLKDAECKFFLTASISERAARRLKDYEAMGIKMSLAETEQELKLRDERDMNRKHSPLKRAEDAIDIDTTDLSIEQVIDRLMDLISAKQEANRG
ncbi:(d)CMP kinase [bacterium]|nr:(d)CMP kinase [bacterium]